MLDTFASGFLGKHLCEYLLENDYGISVYNRDIEQLICLNILK